MISIEEVREALTGPVGDIFTPFNRDGTIDYHGLRNLIDFDIAAGAKAFILTMGDSKYTLLTDDEVADLTKAVSEHVAGRAVVVAADRTWATPKAVDFAKYASSIGADLLMVKPPDFAGSFTEDTLVEHYASVAEHIQVMLVTNVFADRPVQFAIGVMERLIDNVSGVIALKEDNMDEFARRIGLAVHDQWAVICGGQKQNFLNALPYGCDGYMSSYMMFKPEVTQSFWESVKMEDWLGARDIIKNFDLPLYDFGNSLPGRYDASLHGALELFGVAKRWRRKPFHSLDDSEMEKLADFFKGLSLL